MQTPQYSRSSFATFRKRARVRTNPRSNQIIFSSLHTLISRHSASSSFSSASALFGKHRGYTPQKRIFGEAEVLVVVGFATPEAGAGPVSVHETRNQDGEEEHPEDGFDDGKRPGVSGNGSNAGSAQRRESSEAVINKIEPVGHGMEVGVRIEVKSVGANDGNKVEETREAESDEEIDAQRAEDRFGIGMIAGEDALENNAYNEDVEAEAENDVGHREDARVGGLEQPDVLRHGWRAEKNRRDQERAAVTNRVNAEKDHATAHYAEQVVTCGAGIGEGIKDEGREKEDEKKHVTARGRRRRRLGNRWNWDRMFERGCFGHSDTAPLGSFGWYNENIERVLRCDELSSGLGCFVSAAPLLERLKEGRRPAGQAARRRPERVSRILRIASSREGCPRISSTRNLFRRVAPSPKQIRWIGCGQEFSRRNSEDRRGASTSRGRFASRAGSRVWHWSERIEPRCRCRTAWTSWTSADRWKK